MAILTEEQKLMRNSTGLSIARGLDRIASAISDKHGTIYGFHIDSGESDPAAAVTYLKDAVGMTPAAMDYTSGQFNWGSWRDAFFMPRPCMLKFDGTVDYYLDPEDYSKKYDGTASDIADDTYEGNAMIEWGQNGKKIWYKIVPEGDGTSASVYIADYPVDETYVAWSFVNHQNQYTEHFYTPIYNGSLDENGKLRSISGKTNAELCQGKTAAQEIEAAELNNPGENKLWYTEVYADVTLINLLLILMGKSLDCQTVFGNGRINQASAAANMLGTGTMNDKGMFWGGNGNNDGVKVFGMENWWGNQWRRYAGHMLIERVHKYKMTRGTADGSVASDYNTTGDGYFTGATAPSANNYVTKMSFNEAGFVTAEVGGTAATYWCDYFYQNTGTRYALRGGSCSYSLNAGPFCVYLYNSPSYAHWDFGAAPSCKPLS